MRNSRFRQIARFEKLARPFLKQKHEADREWQRTIDGAVNHAAVLAFLARYGAPQISEPLSDAYERCAQSAAWKDCCDEFRLLLPGYHDFLPGRLVRFDLTIWIVSTLSVSRFDTL